MALLRCPLNFTVFHPKLNLVFGPHVQTNWKPAAFDFFETSIGRFSIFSNRCIGHISRKEKKKEKITKAVFQFVGA